MALEYNFFIPIFMGPWYIYSLYRKERLSPAVPLTNNETFKTWSFILSMGIFIEFYLHFFPFSSVAYDMKTRRTMSLTGLAGVTLAAVQHFSNKYMVMYGVGSTWAKMVGISCPGGPHNVSTRLEV